MFLQGLLHLAHVGTYTTSPLMDGGHGVAKLFLELRDSREPAVSNVKKQAKAMGAKRHRFNAWNTLPRV